MSLLGSKTKRVLTYGRRGHRIVNAPDQKPVSDPLASPLLTSSRLENDFPSLRSRADIQQSPRSPSFKKGPPVDSSKSPGKMPKKSIPFRHPLALYEPNTPGSPARPSVRKKKQKVSGNKPSTGLRKSISPLVDLDIIVVDDGGRKLSQERRISRTDVQVNLLTTSPPAKSRPREYSRKKSPKSVTSLKRPLRKPPLLTSPIDIDSDAENEPPLPRAKAVRPRTRAIVISSDESDIEIQEESNACAVPRNHPLLPSQPIINDLTQIPSPSPPPIPVHRDIHYRSKPRQLTPIRRGGRVYPQPHSPPSPVDSDLDAVLNFADISISSIEETFPSPPEYLLPLLNECLQSTPHEFSAFIETFPFDPIVRSLGQEPLSAVEFRKIGEASYSEVFGIGNVVLKIIPLRDEDHTESVSLDLNPDSPPPSDAKDVLTEINVTRTIGEICDGFTKLLRAYVVRGKYPSLLLSCWDEFDEKKGSESIKPGPSDPCVYLIRIDPQSQCNGDMFSVSQTYAIIVLPNGGPDLEAYTFSSASKKCWSQASSIFWQVVRTLATAEDLVSFEVCFIAFLQIYSFYVLESSIVICTGAKY
jgi:serine/threonine-protein kinase haspin